MKRVMIPIILLLIVGLCSGAMASGYEIFMKIDGLPGESTHPRYHNFIDIDSYSYSISNDGTKLGTSTAKHSDFKIVKHADKTTPKLNLYACNNQAIKEVIIEIPAGISGITKHILQYRLTDVRVTSIATTAIAGEAQLPTEDVTLSYDKIELSFIEFIGGTVKDTPTMEWRFSTNKGG